MMGFFDNLSDMAASNLNDSYNISTMDVNDTTGDSDVARTTVYKPIIDYMLLGILIVIMLSMGCEITWEQLYGHIKKPIGILIGMVSQFVIMPLSAFGLIRIVGIESFYATGILIISTCPGGILSNAFTYFSDGDLSLSVAMTSFSTLMAMGMMPLNVWIYGRSLETQDLVIPYSKLALALVSVTSPVAVGMILRWKMPKIAYYITKVGSYIGILLLAACIVLEVIVFPNMFTGVPSTLYAAVFSLPLIGLALGFILASLFRQSMKVKKTIAIECGVQNVPTALTIISLSFDVEHQEEIILLPWLYGFGQILGSTAICIANQIYKRYAASVEARLEKEAKINGVTKEVTEQNELAVISIACLESQTKKHDQ